VNPSLINVGIYTIPEAANLTGLSESRIRRWLTGYTFKTSGSRKKSPPVWSGQLSPIKGRRVVSFRDLIEMKFVDAFLRAGVSWVAIRKVQELARKQFKYDHPFSTNRFRSDGSHIVMTALNEENQESLFDVSTRQQIFLEAAAPFREELEMDDDDTVIRWWPLGQDLSIVLDPTRGWGRPIIARNGLPSSVVWYASQSRLKTSDSAVWFEISSDELDDALAFESSMEDKA